MTTISTFATEENTEIRFGENDDNFIVGCWDIDAGRFYDLRMWNKGTADAKEKALAYYNQAVTEAAEII